MKVGDLQERAFSKAPAPPEVCLKERLTSQLLREALESSAHLLPWRGGWQGGWAGADPAPQPRARSLRSARGAGSGSCSLCSAAAAPHCRGLCQPRCRRAPRQVLPLSRRGLQQPSSRAAGGALRRCPVHQRHLGAVQVARQTGKSGPQACHAWPCRSPCSSPGLGFPN